MHRGRILPPPKWEKHKERSQHSEVFMAGLTHLAECVTFLSYHKTNSAFPLSACFSQLSDLPSPSVFCESVVSLTWGLVRNANSWPTHPHCIRVHVLTRALGDNTQQFREAICSAKLSLPGPHMDGLLKHRFPGPSSEMEFGGPC